MASGRQIVVWPGPVLYFRSLSFATERSGVGPIRNLASEHVNPSMPAGRPRWLYSDSESPKAYAMARYKQRVFPGVHGLG